MHARIERLEVTCIVAEAGRQAGKGIQRIPTQRLSTFMRQVATFYFALERFADAIEDGRSIRAHDRQTSAQKRKHLEPDRSRA
jgi:hypothetical protein